MTEEIKKPDIKKDDPAPGAGGENSQGKENLKNELDKIQKNNTGKTKREKLSYTKKRVEEQLKELDIEEGVTDPNLDGDDDQPLTKGEFKKLKTEEATKTALQLADEISDQVERELVKHHIDNTIRPSGNPQVDLANARAIVNNVKNAQIIEEVNRRQDPKRHSSGSGNPALDPKVEEELTPTELVFTRPPYSLSKAEILGRRPKFDPKK